MFKPLHDKTDREVQEEIYKVLSESAFHTKEANERLGAILLIFKIWLGLNVAIAVAAYFYFQ